MAITIDTKLCDNDAEAVEAIRGLVHRLLPNWQRPELFFEQRSEISGGLTKLLRHIGRDPRPLSVLRNGVPVRATTAPLAAPRAAALAVAAAVFKGPAAAPVAVQGALWPPVPKLRRRHRYPLPPRSLNSQWRLAL